MTLGSDWAQGFGLGQNAVNSGLANARQILQYREEQDEKARKKKVAEGLKTLMDGRYAPTEAQMAGYEATNARLAQQDNEIINDPESRGSLTTQRSASDYQYGAPRRATPMGGSEFANRAAALYAQNDFSDQAMQYGLKGMDYATAEEERAQQAKLRDLQMRQGEQGLAFSAKQNAHTEQGWEVEGKNRAGVAALGDALASGAKMDVPTLKSIASSTGADYTTLMQMASAHLGFDQAVAKAALDKEVFSIKAAVAEGPEAINARLRETMDPNKTDNIVPELRQVQPGVWAIMYGDKPLPGTIVGKDEAGIPGYAQIASKLIADASGDPMSWYMQRLAMSKTQSETKKNYAMSAAYDAEAALRDRTDPNLRAGSGGGLGGSAYKEPTPQMLTWATEQGTSLGWDANKTSEAIGLANMRAAERGVPFSVAWGELTGRPMRTKLPPAGGSGKGVTQLPQLPAKALTLGELTATRKRLQALEKELDAVDGNWIMPPSNPSRAQEIETEMQALKGLLDAHKRAGTGLAK